MAIPETIFSNELPAYQFSAPTIRDAVALGQQSVILYNGLVLNDRLRPDPYRISSIEGLGGADLRDARTPRPVAHGEISYDAYWGGRTITLEGTMESNSVFELSRMERDFRAAFGSLEESPMKFNWWDVEDEFSDAVSSKAWWRTLEGTALEFAGNGLALPKSAGQSLNYYAKRQYVDSRVLLCVSSYTTTTTPKIGAIAKCSSSESYLELEVSEAPSKEMQFVLNAVMPGGNTLELGRMFVEKGRRNLWVELKTVGDKVTIALYSGDPRLSYLATAPEKSTTITLGGELSGRFGYGQAGFAGVSSTGEAFAIEAFVAEGIWPGDATFDVRPIATPMIKHGFQKGVDKFRRDFQVAVRASNPHHTVSVPVSATIQLVFSQLTNSVTVVNHGTWTALPSIVLFGGSGLNPRVTNVTTDEHIQLEGFISQSITIDSAHHTIFDAQGTNRFDLFSPQSSFPVLAPGPNQLVLSRSPSNLISSETLSGTIEWKHASI